MKAALRAAGFYTRWYPKQWLPFGGVDTSGLDPALAKQVRYVKKTSRKLARRMYHAMLINGPKLERKQMTLGRFVEIGTELFAMTAACAYARAPGVVADAEVVLFSPQDEHVEVLDHMLDRLAAG